MLLRSRGILIIFSPHAGGEKRAGEPDSGAREPVNILVANQVVTRSVLTYQNDKRICHHKNILIKI